LKVISTFAGCGGSSLGYKLAGCEVIAAIEWDDNAIDCYRANHPTTKIFHGDVAKVSGEELLNATGLDVGELDVLDGSPPCQGFSTAGSRVLSDPRNGLFREQLRLIDELQPKNVVIENVSGMVKGKMRRVAAEIVRELKSRDYQVTAGLLEAQYFGVAQLRPRVFFLGSKTHQPKLPRPITRPIPAKRALRDIVPEATREITAPSMRLLVKHLRPGEKGSDVLGRLGRTPNWFSKLMLHPDRVCPTLTKSAGDYFHWTRRYLAANERLVLTGFPEDYKLIGTWRDRCARVGNSVAPPVTAAIARSLMSQG